MNVNITHLLQPVPSRLKHVPKWMLLGIYKRMRIIHNRQRGNNLLGGFDSFILHPAFIKFCRYQ